MLDPTVILRDVELNDAVGVVETVREVFDEYSFTWEASGYHADLYDLTTYCNKSVSDFWVAELKGSIVGCGGVRYFDPVQIPVGHVENVGGKMRIGGCTCEIVRLYVRPSARRKGIGGAIMHKIMESMSLRGASHCEIWSDKLFFDAHTLYQKFGAITVGERICDDPDQAPEWGLLLSL